MWITYVSEEFVDDILAAGHGGSLDRILEKLVLFRQRNRLVPAFVLSVDVCCNLSEEDETACDRQLPPTRDATLPR
jgi:hypothetical protein